MRQPFLISTFIDRINNDIIFTRISSLTYQTFLAIVPILAVMFGIAKGFGFDHAFEAFLRRELAEHKEMLDYLVQFSQTTLHETQGGLIAGAGVAILLFTTMRLFSSVEETFNVMWGIAQPRRYMHRAVSYLAVILLCPMLLAIAGSSAIFISTRISLIAEQTAFTELNQLFLASASLVPVITLAILFSSLLYIIPSAAISMRSAICSGLLAAICFHLVQLWYIQLQLLLTKIGAIYGSFVAIPLFLAWLWVSWAIFLFAGEISVLIEEKLWRYSKSSYEIDRRACYIAIISLVLRRYQESDPIALSELKTQLQIPIKLFYSSFESLKEMGLVLEAIHGNSSNIYLVPSAKALQYTSASLIFDKPLESTDPMISAEIRQAQEKLDRLKKVIEMQPENRICP